MDLKDIDSQVGFKERSTKGVYSGCEPKCCKERMMCVSAPTSSRNVSDQSEASIHHEGDGDIKEKKAPIV
jgi:hypothetical protein